MRFSGLVEGLFRLVSAASELNPYGLGFNALNPDSYGLNVSESGVQVPGGCRQDVPAKPRTNIPTEKPTKLLPALIQSMPTMKFTMLGKVNLTKPC